MSVLSTILPLFALIVLGFGCVRAGYIPAAHIRPIGDFVIKVALPALIFNAVSGLSLGEALNPGFLAAYGGASALVFAAALAFARRVPGADIGTAGVVALGMACSNSGFMGYPLALNVIGPEAAALLAQTMVVENIVIIPAALMLAEARGGGHGWRAAWRAVRGGLRNPILIALGAALAVSVSGLALPEFLGEAIAMLSNVASPIALFVLGGTLASLSMAGVRGLAAVIVTGKLVLHPVAVFAGLMLVPGLDDWMIAGGTLFAAVPMLSIYPLLGSRAGAEMLSATALLMAVVVSFVTLSVWIAALERVVSF
ncbi:permease [Rhodobacteraceae bacterium WD3A24]|nr:permease [Rhodobacteraceae bacterium WD3A24]